MLPKIFNSNWYTPITRRVAPKSLMPIFFTHWVETEFKYAILPHICIESYKILWLKKHCKITTVYKTKEQSMFFKKQISWLDNSLALHHLLSDSGPFKGRT